VTVVFRDLAAIIFSTANSKESIIYNKK